MTSTDTARARALAIVADVIGAGVTASESQNDKHAFLLTVHLDSSLDAEEAAHAARALVDNARSSYGVSEVAASLAVVLPPAIQPLTFYTVSLTRERRLEENTTVRVLAANEEEAGTIACAIAEHDMLRSAETLGWNETGEGDEYGDPSVADVDEEGLLTADLDDAANFDELPDDLRAATERERDRLQAEWDREERAELEAEVERARAEAVAEYNERDREAAERLVATLSAGGLTLLADRIAREQAARAGME